MKYNFNGKEINIEDEILDNLTETLDLTLEEAIQTYLEDEGYLENEEVEVLSKKAKENKSVQHDAKSDKPRAKRTVTKKENPLKQDLITLFAETLRTNGIAAKITNSTKIVEFTIDGREFKLDLVEKRQKKDK